jgi:ribosomal protein L44E
MNRKQRRKLGIKKNKESDVEEKLGIFDKLPLACTNCDLAYDKKDKTMAMSWTVVVREEEQKVNLYCPTCWENANKLIQKIKEEIDENKN